MRVLLSILFLFFVFLSDAFGCEPGQEPDENDANYCNACSANAYSDDGTRCKPCSDVPNNGDNLYPYSVQFDPVNRIGARSKYECYRKRNNTTGAYTGMKCKTSTGERFNGECHEFYRDQDAADNNYRGDDEHHWVSCSSEDDGFDIGECSGNNCDLVIDYDGFHMEKMNSESNAVCYQNKLDCTKFPSKIETSDNESISLSDNGCSTPENEDQKFIEWKKWGNDYVWKKENNLGCGCEIANPTTQDWYDDLTFSSWPFSDMYSGHLAEFCEMSSITFKGGRLTGDASTVQLAEVHYGVDSSNSSHVPDVSNTSWKCSGCPAGKVGFFKYTSNNDSVRYCAEAVTGCYSDGCVSETSEDDPRAACLDPDYVPDNYYGAAVDKDLLQKWLCGVTHDYNLCITQENAVSGPFCVYYYLDEPYGYNTVENIWLRTEIYNVIYQYYNDSYKRLQKFYHPCYAGQTTEGIGSTSIEYCTYSDDTVFFDAYGTFKLNNMGNWRWWYEEGFNQPFNQGGGL